jgi:hypothetical protein
VDVWALIVIAVMLAATLWLVGALDRLQHRRTS